VSALRRLIERREHDRYAIRSRGAQPRGEVGWAGGVIGQRPQQLEQVRHRRVTRDHQLRHPVRDQTLHQRTELRRDHPLVVDHQHVVDDPDGDVSALQHPDQGPKLPLLFVLLGRVPEQVDGARQMSGEDDRNDHVA
jgi:hypothetical protein